MQSGTSSLSSLIAVARQDGVDIRPTLLRALTDLFVEQEAHSAVELQRYRELAGRLLDSADADLRRHVAIKLSQHRAAPREILMQLARADLDVATPILTDAHFSEADLHTLFDTLPLRHKQVIATRSDLPVSIATRLGDLTRDAARSFQTMRTTRETTPAAAPHEQSDIAKRIANARERATRALAALPTARVRPAAAAPQRSAILPEVDTAAALQALETSAMERRPQMFAEWLCRTFGFDPELAHRIVSDQTGEAIAVVCKALDMPNDTFSRVILFLDPQIGQSVVKVFALAEYFGRLSVEAARLRCARWREYGQRPTRRYQPATMPDGAGRHRPSDERRHPVATERRDRASR